MPNPHHDPSTGQFTNAPDPNQPPEGGEQQPDPWAAVREAGITPEQALQGGRLYADLNNLDRRQQALQSVIRPDIDTWIGQQGQGQEEPDPFDRFGDPEEPYGYEPEPQAQHQPAFNPQEFARQVVELAKGESTKEIQNWLQGMMQAQQVTETATSVAKEVGLPPSDAQFIEHQVKTLSEQQPNRAPADIAREVAQARANELAQWAQQAGATPPVEPASPGTPGGPVPSPHPAPPQSTNPADYEKWAIERSKEGLD